jgi:hypothetical protein
VLLPKNKRVVVNVKLKAKIWKLLLAKKKLGVNVAIALRKGGTGAGPPTFQTRFVMIKAPSVKPQGK